MTRRESLIDFILGSCGCADSMAEPATFLDVDKMYELIADNEGEDLFPDLPGEVQ